jgi:antitoxin (DNA-binding transcriptional repressor) of toxin-antitoxin stability system
LSGVDESREKGITVMKTKQYDLLHHSSDLNELLSEITEDTEIVITKGNIPIARLLPTDVDALIRTTSGKTAIQLERGDNASPNALTRRLNLHPGAFVIRDDFDEPLPDSFWLGEA